MTQETYNFQTNTFDNPASVIVNSTTYGNPESVITDSFTYIPTPTIKMVSTVHPIPHRATSGAAGYDIRAVGNHTLPSGAMAVIPTGIHLDIPPGLFGMLVSRSGLAVTKGVTLANGIGIIDSDFHGEVRVAIINKGQDEFEINEGDRIAQLLFMTVAAPDFISVTDLSTSTTRDPAGFGSTGVE